MAAKEIVRKASVVIASTSLFAMGASHAACGTTGCTDVLIDELYVNANYVVFVATSGTETAINCTPVSGTHLTLDPSDSNYNAVYSLLLAAQLADRPVSIRTVDGSANCKISYVVLDRV